MEKVRAHIGVAVAGAMGTFAITIHSIRPNIFFVFSDDFRTNVSIAPATATPMCVYVRACFQLVY